ncbi:TraX family protein [Enterococcus casseliflavus]|uniref:TraX family protein n=1 Tax=Enterococcus casseliflavus TaxID=37734 RepID=UPI00119FF6A3|nr:TraX family protein [Enterococcus casseliflavus]
MDQVLQKQPNLSGNALKYIAITAMFFDHFFAVFVVHESMAGSLLRITGRVVAPIMCYLIAEGFNYTSDIKKYTKRLLLFALISHFPYVWYFNLPWWKATSVMWGLVLGLLALTFVKKTKHSVPIKMLAVFICCILAYNADWNFISVLWILFFGLYKNNFEKQILSFTMIGIFFYIIPTLIRSGVMHSYEFGIFLSIPILSMYNGKPGKKQRYLKWGFYIFYPLHLLILYLLRLTIL